MKVKTRKMLNRNIEDGINTGLMKHADEYGPLRIDDNSEKALKREIRLEILAFINCWFNFEDEDEA